MPHVVYLVRDLLFTSKIRETCKQLGFDAKMAPSAGAIVSSAKDAAMVILDLRNPDGLTALDALRADPGTAAIPAVGFIDHERTDVMDDARARGCQDVLAKGAFSTKLPTLLGALQLRSP